jgi:hypothetical protein
MSGSPNPAPAVLETVSKTSRPTDRVLCELVREKSLVRVSEVTLSSGAKKLTLTLWYTNQAGVWTPSHALSLNPGEAVRLRAALGRLRTSDAKKSRQKATETRRKAVFRGQEAPTRPDPASGFPTTEAACDRL